MEVLVHGTSSRLAINFNLEVRRKHLFFKKSFWICHPKFVSANSVKKKKKKRLGESGRLRPGQEKYRFFDGEWSMHTCHFMSAIFLYYSMLCKAVLRKNAV